MVVAPTILAATPVDYAERIDRVKSFATRLHVDVSDGLFAPGKTVSLARVYDIEGAELDLHLMVERPAEVLHEVVSLQPQLVIWHFEAQGDHAELARELQAFKIKAGLAVLPGTNLELVRPLLPELDHVLVFAGKLGSNGGSFDAAALDRIRQVRSWATGIEIGVDGGVNAGNAAACVGAGTDVLYVGSAIHSSPDPKAAYDQIVASANA